MIWFFGKKKEKKEQRKGGFVYTGESTRSDGSKKVYVGSTTRKPQTRWGEHIKEVKKKDSKTWVGKGKNFEPTGAVWSSNPRKAEQTLKKKSPAQKRRFASYASRKYKRRKY